MLTDAPPRKANRAGFIESDQTRTLDLPQDGSLLTITKSIESAMEGGKGRTFGTPAPTFWRPPQLSMKSRRAASAY
jgi:hypothetical protein